MNIAVIGASGHLYTAFQGVEPRRFAGMAPGCALEDASRIKTLAAERGIPYFDDWRAMLDELRPDAVVVNTVYAYNAGICMETLRRGIHTYAEKPAAATLAELVALEQAASGHALLFSMLTARFDPAFYTARSLIRAGAIGEPRLLTGQKSYKLGTRPAFYANRDAYGGTIPWVAIHSIDQILWLTGLTCLAVEARHSAAANGGNGSMEATALIQMELTGGVLASVSADLLRPAAAPTHGDDRIRAAGTKGVLEVRGGAVYLTGDGYDSTQPQPLLPCPAIFDTFLRLAHTPGHGAGDDLYRDCGALACTRAALLARDSADRR